MHKSMLFQLHITNLIIYYWLGVWLLIELAKKTQCLSLSSAFFKSLILHVFDVDDFLLFAGS